MTLATPRVVPVRQAKAFILSRKVTRVTLPAGEIQLADPSCPDPRDGFAILM